MPKTLSRFPALTAILLLPRVVAWLYPPGVGNTPEAPVAARKALAALGRLSRDERITAGDLARLRTTNRWEVVTQMAARLPRVYDAASAPVDVWTLTDRRG